MNARSREFALIAAALVGVIVIVSVVAVVIRFDELSGSALLSLVATGLGLIVAGTTLVTDSGRRSQEASRRQSAKVFEKISEADDLLSVLAVLSKRDDADGTKALAESAAVMGRLLKIRQALVDLDELAEAAKIDSQMRVTLKDRPDWLLWKANAGVVADETKH